MALITDAPAILFLDATDMKVEFSAVLKDQTLQAVISCNGLPFESGNITYASFNIEENDLLQQFYRNFLQAHMQLDADCIYLSEMPILVNLLLGGKNVEYLLLIDSINAQKLYYLFISEQQQPVNASPRSAEKVLSKLHKGKYNYGKLNFAQINRQIAFDELQCVCFDGDGFYLFEIVKEEILDSLLKLKIVNQKNLKSLTLSITEISEATTQEAYKEIQRQARVESIKGEEILKDYERAVLLSNGEQNLVMFFTVLQADIFINRNKWLQRSDVE